MSRLPRDITQRAQLRIHGVRQAHPLVSRLRAADLGGRTREAREPPLGAPADDRDDGERGDGDDERATRRATGIPAQRGCATHGGEEARREITYARLSEPPARGKHCHCDGRWREQGARTRSRQEPSFRVDQDDLLRSRHCRSTGAERRRTATHKGDAAG